MWGLSFIYGILDEQISGKSPNCFISDNLESRMHQVFTFTLFSTDHPFPSKQTLKLKWSLTSLLQSRSGVLAEFLSEIKLCNNLVKTGCC